MFNFDVYNSKESAINSLRFYFKYQQAHSLSGTQYFTDGVGIMIFPQLRNNGITMV